jgi:3-deoxy-D-manno-octulosonic acid kinase
MHTPANSQIEGSILYEPSLVGKPEHQLFEPEYWQSRGIGTAMAGGRGQVLFIRDDQRKWVLRHYRRGGLIAKFNPDQYLWTGAEATRSFREWRLLAKLVDIGLPVPAPIAARYVRQGVMYRADLITREIDGARSLAAVLKNQSLSAEYWQAIGVTLARFHTHGVRHADLNAHNMVLDHADAIHVLDFDRGTIQSPRQSWIDQVLARLLRSIHKLQSQQGLYFNDADWQLLLTAHNAELQRLMR